MKISVVIPTYNRISSLQLVIAGLNRQSYPADQFEVVVVSDGSTDGTNQYLCELLPQFRLMTLLQENKGVASARNAGINYAEGDIIVFLDDDTVPTSNFLEEHQRTHELHSPDSIVIGPMLVPKRHRLNPWGTWEQSRLEEQYHAMTSGQWQPTSRQFYTANASISRRHLLESGGFDPAFRRAEDVELAFRLERKGLYFIFNPDAVVYHYAERSFESWISIPYAYGSNDVIFTYQKNQSWLLPTVYKEFHTRHPFIKILIRLCLNRNKSTHLSLLVLKQLIQLFDKLGWVNLSHLACSGIFNLRYYQGISDGLSNRQAFFSGVRNSVHS